MKGWGLSLVARWVLTAVTVALPSDTGAGGWPGVQIPDPVARRAVRQALDQGWTWLGTSRCRRVLSQFSDRNGRSLATGLDSMDVDPQTYLTWVKFIDDSRNPWCTEGVIGFTNPGHRVVRLCTHELVRRWPQDTSHIVAVLIHEMLHTLGLGENPPASSEITRRIRESCRPD
jgi:hypothetical protein